MSITDFFGMFDKVDDIIYAPINLVCDALRQPLKNMDAASERKKIELNHRLEVEMKKIGVDLDIDRQKRSVEIDEWVKDKEFERQKDILTVIQEYQRDMGTTAVEIGDAIGKMSIDLQERAQDMIVEKSKRFYSMQEEALEKARNGVKEIQMMFPEDDEIRREMVKPYTKMMMNVVEETDGFIKDMKESMKKLSENINVITDKVVDNTNKYITPLCGGQLGGLNGAQSQTITLEKRNSSGYIEQK